MVYGLTQSGHIFGLDWSVANFEGVSQELLSELDSLGLARTDKEMVSITRERRLRP